MVLYLNFALGKSFALLADPIRDFNNPNFSGVIVRKTTEELRDLIQQSQELYPKVYPGSKFNRVDNTWRSPKGGRLWLSYLDADSDVTRYQGQAYNYIGFDELTQWATPYAWDYMRSRLRTKDPTLKLYMRATTNSGGIGHTWVKKMFIDPAPWGKAFDATNIETGETLSYPRDHSKAGQPLFQRRFIPAKLSDNPYLYDDGQYEAMLLSLPEHEKRRLLYGDWDVISGAAFPEWNREIHVCEPFEIPYGWRKFRSCDYGYGSFSAVLWFAVTPSEQLIVYRELYVSRTLASDLSDIIADLEKDDGIISYGILDSSCWHQRGDIGVSIYNQMAKNRWRPSDRSKGSRVSGKVEVHRRLQVDDWLEEPRLLIFNSCTNLIAQLPVLPLDKDNVEDVDTKAEDHLYDALRYGCMSRPRSSNWDVDPNTSSKYRPSDRLFGY